MKTLKQVYQNKIASHNKLQAAHYRQQWKQAVRQASKRTQIFKIKQKMAALEEKYGIDKIRKELFAATMAKDTDKAAALRQQIATATKQNSKWQELAAKIKEIKGSFHDLELINWTQKEVRIAAQKVNEEEITLQAVKHLSKQFAVEVQVELFRMASKEIQAKYNQKILLYCSAVLGNANDIKQLYQSFKKYDEPDYMVAEWLDDQFTQIESVAIRKKMTEILSLTSYNKIYDACTELIKKARKYHAKLTTLENDFNKAAEALGFTADSSEENGWDPLSLVAFQQSYEALVTKYFTKLADIGHTAIQDINKYIDSTDILETIEHYQNLIKDITGDENN